jgi:hypothetical protein
MLGALKKLFGGDSAAAEGQPTQQQLIELFQKRNLLKRAYDKTAAELKQTREELEHVQRTSQQVHKRLAALDAMLADPERGQSVIVHYQLEALWAKCNGLLAERMIEFKSRYEAEEQQKLLQDFVAKQRERLATLKERLQLIAAGMEEFSTQRRATEQALAAAGQFWHYFKRKKLEARLAELDGQIAPLDQKRRELTEEIAKTEGQEAPKYPGLSVPSKRLVNLQLIALAQYLYMELLDDAIGENVHKAHGKAPDEVDFGYTPDCLRMLKSIGDAGVRLANDPERQRRVMERYALLESKAKYPNGADVLPERSVYEFIDGSIAKRAVPPPTAAVSMPGAGGIGSFLPTGGGMNIEVGNLQVDIVTGDYFGFKELMLG